MWVVFCRACDTSHPGQNGQNYVMPGNIKHVTFNRECEKYIFLQLKNFSVPRIHIKNEKGRG